MTRVAFEKWQGLGNDFLVIDAGSFDPEAPAALVAALCDRRRGVGADGILVVDRRGPVARMIVRNADGSRPEMCGNGLRCVAGRLAAEHPADVFDVATDAGNRRVRVASGSRAGRFDVRLDMGVARGVGDHELDDGGLRLVFRRVDVGNPHAVVFGVGLDEALADRVGPRVSAALAGGSNVEFCELEPAVAGAPPTIRVVVWERGVGRTLACGTGACAVAFVAGERGWATPGEPVRVVLPGGALEVVIAPSGSTTLRGPAERVFSGTLDLADF